VGPLDATYAAGLHLWLGGPEDGAPTMALVASGRRRPDGGSIAGLLPSGAPSCPRDFAWVGPSSANTGLTLGQWAHLAGLARGDTGPTLLERIGWVERRATRVNSLSAADGKFLRLAEALLAPRTSFLFLDDPLEGLSEGQTQFFRETLATKRRTAVVIITTRSLDFGDPPPDSVTVFYRGAVLSTAVAPDAIDTPARAMLFTDRPADVAATVAQAAGLLAIERHAQAIRVTFDCRANLDAAIANSTNLTQVLREPPQFEEVRADVAGYSAGVYQAAYERGRTAEAPPATERP
jgi:ABC-type multidrug transport system ATPase subunit